MSDGSPEVKQRCSELMAFPSVPSSLSEDKTPMSFRNYFAPHQFGRILWASDAYFTSEGGSFTFYRSESEEGDHSFNAMSSKHTTRLHFTSVGNFSYATSSSLYLQF